jgi:hypothetical protein
MTTDKLTTLTLKLTEAQVEALQVMAAKACYTDYKAFAKDQFREAVLEAKIGVPRVGAGPKITAPSTNNHYTHLNT